jgi:phosphopantothenoylcysteine synthetase/decarboxylase
MNCRVAAIVDNYREINLSRSAMRGQNNLALRNNLDALTAAGGKNKKRKVIIVIIIYSFYLFFLVILFISIVTY